MFAANNEPGFFNFLVMGVILLLVAGYWVARIRMMWIDPGAHRTLVEGEREERNKKLSLIGGILGMLFRK